MCVWHTSTTDIYKYIYGVDTKHERVIGVRVIRTRVTPLESHTWPYTVFVKTCKSSRRFRANKNANERCAFIHRDDSCGGGGWTLKRRLPLGSCRFGGRETKQKATPNVRLDNDGLWVLCLVYFCNLPVRLRGTGRKQVSVDPPTSLKGEGVLAPRNYPFPGRLFCRGWNILLATTTKEARTTKLIYMDTPSSVTPCEDRARTAPHSFGVFEILFRVFRTPSIKAPAPFPHDRGCEGRTVPRRRRLPILSVSFSIFDFVENALKPLPGTSICTQ